MAIKRYFADADGTITNAYKSDLKKRGTGSNMGLADSLETFNIYQQASSASFEEARILIKFPISDISTDRTSNTIAASGSTSFYLKMYNVKHSQTLPQNYNLQIFATSQSWDEGRGVDMDEYLDSGESNWMSASSTTAWSMTGGSAHTSSGDLIYTQNMYIGNEDLDIDITDLVEYWIAETYDNYGLLIRMSGTLTGNSDSLSRSFAEISETFYTKKFSSRTSEFFFKRPIIEARWDSRTRDDRGNFYYSSSLAPAEDNLNTLYLYNIVRGKLANIPDVGTGLLRTSLYSGSLDNAAPSGSKLTLVQDDTHVTADSTEYATAGYVSTGIYSCSVAITSSKVPLTNLFDVWYSGSTRYFTGSIRPMAEEAELVSPSNRYVLSITNLKQKYDNYETARFRLFVRDKNWSPNIYSRATSEVIGNIIESASYMIYRTVDDLKAIPYGTGSYYYSFLSYDKSGSYFDLDMSMLDPGYQYGIKFSFYNDSAGGWQEQPYTFKFRVERI